MYWEHDAEGVPFIAPSEQDVLNLVAEVEAYVREQAEGECNA